MSILNRRAAFPALLTIPTGSPTSSDAVQITRAPSDARTLSDDADNTIKLAPLLAKRLEAPQQSSPTITNSSKVRCRACVHIAGWQADWLCTLLVLQPPNSKSRQSCNEFFDRSTKGVDNSCANSGAIPSHHLSLAAPNIAHDAGRQTARFLSVGGVLNTASGMPTAIEGYTGYAELS
jgi:hypothetical protein